MRCFETLLNTREMAGSLPRQPATACPPPLCLGRKEEESPRQQTLGRRDAACCYYRGYRAWIRLVLFTTLKLGLVLKTTFQVLGSRAHQEWGW